jgi:hypothetical protein
MMRLVWGRRTVEEVPVFLREADEARRILRKHDQIIWFLRLVQRSALQAQEIVCGAASFSPAQRRRHQRLQFELGPAIMEPKGTNHGTLFLNEWEKALVVAKEVPFLTDALKRLQLQRFTQLPEATQHVRSMREQALLLLVHQRFVEDFIVFPDGWKWVLCRYGESEWEGRFGSRCDPAT